jgi:beta-glucanase (GH16 family)
MKMPLGPGTWPAFWLGTLPPSDPAAPGIEIDVLEYYGHDSSKFQSAVHVWNKNESLSRHTVHSTPVPSGSLSNDFHTFGVRVAPDLITFYLDRRAVWQVDTPPELKMPLYPIANLALGSGYPINQTPNPSRLLVDYIHTFGPLAEGQSDQVGCKGGKP